MSIIASKCMLLLQILVFVLKKNHFDIFVVAASVALGALGIIRKGHGVGGGKTHRIKQWP